MIAPTPEHYVLPESVPTLAVYVLAAAAVGAWIAIHFLWPRPRGCLGRAVRFVGCVLVGFGAMETLWQAMQRGLVLATNWWLWPLALGGALAVETVVALYARERQTVSRPVGLALSGMRVLLVALVIVMLAQPVRPWNLDKTLQRWVAVLLDTSASMYVPDTQLAPGERLRLADRLGVEGADRPFALGHVAERIETLRNDLSAQAAWLAGLASADAESRSRQLADRREAMNRTLVETRKVLVKHAQALEAPLESDLKLDGKVTGSLEAIRKRLTGPIRDKVKEAAALTAESDAGALETGRRRLLAIHRQVVRDLDQAVPAIEALGESLDAAAYAALPEAVRKRVDEVASRKRLTLARDVLFAAPASAAGETKTPGRPEGAEAPGEEPAPAGSLLDRLRERYSVELYTFASKAEPADVASTAETYAAGQGVDADAADLPPDQQQTNLTAVFDEVMGRMADKRLSGILLLSDGRHNAPGSVEPLVRRLGIRQVPVSSIVFGGEKPPIDAGIISVSAPEAIAEGDRLLVTAQVKLDGLADREVQIALREGEEEVDTETVRVQTDSHRVRIQLADKPDEVRLHRYVVVVQAFENEVLATNNRYPLAVSVSDERTQLLLVDGRPRWEFRYIKNLFASRDRSVHLQYVLMEPDNIAGVPAPPKVHASASRPMDEVEATALPETEAEWMKFDVVILGDVPPDVLGEAEQEVLKRFVQERGGTLVAIAGPEFMPHAYADGPLAEMLPVSAKAASGPIPAPAEEKFHLALTTDGRESVVMRQKVKSAENLEVWAGLPPIYWQHPEAEAKEGATVLAYALPTDPPDYMPDLKPDPAAGETDLDADTLAKRRAFQRRHALISHHTVATGRVMFLGFDRTWRLRYRVGDTYHHRFWGQVLRWATADKLPAGTQTVRIGTDRTRYAPGGTVSVTARIAQEDFTPVTGLDDVAVDVFAGEDKVMRRTLEFVEGSPGRYKGNLGTLPTGAYRVELDAPAAEPILRRQNAGTVSTEFSVDPATPAEQAELAPDRGLLSRLAGLTGGTVTDPARAERALAGLGPVTEVNIERHEYVLWDSLPMLLLIVALATAEWLLRKKVGLA